ncbi:HpcH/HpaI aldolase/citrate lyase family protein [Jatrophihabitans endophyticus]|uniref:HpcH/HpaI aldolase/citrate lyase family protein n=1 Tax=Jatrophihabitans endophyticus TaxID=1206085 RepID=UPI0019F5BDD1|nr:HpcH/HpaI aldolase/citrate lyase family protein [Jatrophihabitans endophyticus]MBE7189928.1 HpcH/HpaI aldolase/citrate lyase family protein [Jatrophihabitans endophyticus]
MTRHFDFLDAGERDRLFVRAPEPFDADADPDVLGTGLGATLYTPATRPALAHDIARSAARGVTSVVVCLEDAVSDRDLAGAERNAVAQLRELHRSGAAVPLVFVRVRRPDQIAMVVDGLGGHEGVLAGFVAPKFTEDTGDAFLTATVAASERVGRRLLVMPVLESPELGHAESRVAGLLGARRLLDKYRAHVPAVRVGATDLSSAFGLRRAREFTVWDVRVVADVLAAVVNVFSRAESPYVIAGPVWEYFPSSERIFRPQLRMTPFAESADRALRAELLAADLDGLIREVELDRANGLTGKTVIHPSHVAAVHALSVVSAEQFADARDVLADERGGASASSFGNKMNESKPHAGWARRTLTRAQVFGVVREGVSFVDLLGAVLHP